MSETTQFNTSSMNGVTTQESRFWLRAFIDNTTLCIQCCHVVEKCLPLNTKLEQKTVLDSSGPFARETRG